MNRRDGGPAFPGMQHGLVVPIELAAQASTVKIPHNGMSLRDYFVAHSNLTLAEAKAHWFDINGRYGPDKPDMGQLLDLLAKMRGMQADSMIAERAA
jgi:hypothetical protein